jgi:hypothetical protein
MSLGTSLGSSVGSFDGSLLGSLLGSSVGMPRDGLRLVLELLSAGDFLSGEPCPPDAISTTTTTAAAATITANRTNSGLRRARGGGS